ncbi:hypothetical protein TUMEXPCC7403_12520 [Tumidithrix helvetica PCC 7403]|uniref:hypothetical protein n=1 Tax=Tumidithrix helvetica TaxID=3457545 RepID=UPI003C9D8FBD
MVHVGKNPLRDSSTTNIDHGFSKAKESLKQTQKSASLPNIDRDTAFRPISQKGLDEILKLAKFLERLEFNDWKKSSTTLLNEVESIIKSYKNLLTLCKDGKDSQSFKKYKDEKSWLDLPKYFNKVHNQLDKLPISNGREKELCIICIFLQKKLHPNDLLKLEKILDDYLHELERVRGRSI